MKLRIGHLYPDLLNLYGDRGNLIALRQRCLWRGIECEILPLSLGQPFTAADYDLLFLGGGQDHEQNLLLSDLIDLKGPALREAIEADLPVLCVCGGYQLMGRYYQEADGRRIEGLGVLDLYTEAIHERMIGDVIAEAPFLAEQGRDSLLIGFENHSGRTWLGPGVRPLAHVRTGHGNNGRDKTEGAVYKQVYGTYLHGSFLPKNPEMADQLILKALQSRHHELDVLTPLPNELENRARQSILASHN
ncbi:MAG: glutamine amidotransferase [Eubacteriales bacterium]|nr:glutamine amidotransferase [Eubacteriales bacterium]